jgi:phosphoheptose isomerase
MDRIYWIGRQAAAKAMARGASSAQARLIHYELAGRYSVKAAQCPAFILADQVSAAADSRAELHLPGPAAR